jgi:lipase
MTVLHTSTFGDPAGEPLLAIHGITAHGKRFQRSGNEGWAHRRTVAVDLRGHGFSTWEAPWSVAQHVQDLLDTLDAAGLGDPSDPIDVVGHSYGGEIALHLLERAPERIKRVVLLDPALERPSDWASTMAATAIANPGWGSIEEAEIARSTGLGQERHPAAVQDVAEHVVLGDDGRYRTRTCLPAVVTGWGELALPLPPLHTVRPTLLVIADKAGIVTDGAVAGLQQRLGDQLSIEHLDCGHMLYWERFDETAALVREFLS